MSTSHARAIVCLFALTAFAALRGSAAEPPQQKDDERRRQEAAEMTRRRLQEAAAREREMAQMRAQENAAKARALAVVAQQVWSDEQFEQWIFQQDRNAAGARKRFDSQVTITVDEIDRACKLTDAQKNKLKLTARGDIKRFFDDYERVKARFASVNNDINRLQDIMADVNPLRMSLQAGPFHEDSLLHKSLRNTLGAEQHTKYDAVVRERREFRHRANIERAVTMLEQGTPLSAAQRRDFIALLTKETKPPRKPSQYDFYLIMFQIGKLPDDKVKPLFSGTQWTVISRQVDQYKGVEPQLRMQGLITDVDEDGGKDDAPRAVPK